MWKPQKVLQNHRIREILMLHVHKRSLIQEKYGIHTLTSLNGIESIYVEPFQYFVYAWHWISYDVPQKCLK